MNFRCLAYLSCGVLQVFYYFRFDVLKFSCSSGVFIPVLTVVVNEGNSPRGQSPEDELTADVYSSSSERKENCFNASFSHLIHNQGFSFSCYRFVALSIGLPVVVLETVIRVYRSKENNSGLKFLSFNSQLFGLIPLFFYKTINKKWTWIFVSI